MKNYRVLTVCISILAFLLTSMKLLAQTYAPPTYRGKVILVVDKTMAADWRVAAKIDRLTQDLVGDGWRVLRHDVERGPDLPFQGSLSDNGVNDFAHWGVENAYRIREVRALIKADCDAAPDEVRSVLLIGHVPVPYSGHSQGTVEGNHFGGAKPADCFYGDMVSPYGYLGWTDLLTAPNPFGDFGQCDNRPEDGKFDQGYMPSPMQLGIGRVDLSQMDTFGINEATMLSRYLDKDHDFRSGVIQANRSAIFAFGDVHAGPPYQDGAQAIFGPAIDYFTYADPQNNDWLWFPHVNSSSGQSYVLGSYTTTGGTDGAARIGSTGEEGFGDGHGDINDNFKDVDSRVLFVNFYSSFMGVWDTTNDFLRAPLCNPYDPANGRYGYGLCAVYGGLGLDVGSMTKEALGATIGQALYDGYTSIDQVNLMGDPTLRMFNVLPPAGLTIVASGSTANLSWTGSADSSLAGYNIYSAPTMKGPFTLINTGGAVSGNSYSATRPLAGSSGYVPDNFYMVRAVKTETTLVGSYLNMSDGITAKVPGDLVSYLAILTQPANQYPTVDTQDGTANSVAFSVDAVGCDSTGDDQLTYQWYKGSTPIAYSDAHMTGANTRSILVKGIQTSDAGTYSVRISNNSKRNPLSPNSIMSGNAQLNLNPALPVAQPHTVIVYEDTPADIDVLQNGTSGTGLPLRLLSFSQPGDPTVGILTTNNDQTIHFVPVQGRPNEQVTFTYQIGDGANKAQETVTLDIIVEHGNQPPTIAGITPNQQLTVSQGAELEIPFTVSDDITPSERLNQSLTCSDPGLVCNVIGTGNNRTLRLAGVEPESGATVTLGYTDGDFASTFVTVTVTVAANADRPTLSFGNNSIAASGGSFTFNVAGQANATWTVYGSTDLQNWTPMGSPLTLLGDGTGSFTDNDVSGEAYHFYKLSNGTTASQAMGFERTLVQPPGASHAGLNSLLADQLIQTPGQQNTLAQAFGQTTLPNGSQLFKYNGSTSEFDSYTYSAGNWSGSTTLNPGESAYLYLPNENNPVTVTFVGLVPEGSYVMNLAPVNGDQNFYLSSVIPITGYVTNVFGISNQYDPNLGAGLLDGDEISLIDWDKTDDYYFESNPANYPVGQFTGFSDDPFAITPEACPRIGVAQGLIFNTEGFLSDVMNYIPQITQSYSPVGGDVPALNSGQLSGGSFTFNANGVANASTIWTVYGSADLQNWTSVGSVTLNSTGAGSFTDSGVSGETCHFYKLSNGVNTSQAIGFEQVVVGAGQTLIANQLDASPDNTLNSVFLPSEAQANPPPDGMTLYKYTSSGTYGYIYHTSPSPNWSPIGGTSMVNATLAPGEGGIIANPGTVPFTLTFVGTVKEGQLTIPLSAAYNLVSSIIPQTGGIQSVLAYNPLDGDTIEFIQADTSTLYWYSPSVGLGSTTGWYDENLNPSPEPVVNVGQAFYLYTQSPNMDWIRSFSVSQ